MVLMTETRLVGAEKGREEHGRRDRDAADVFTAAGPDPSRGRDDPRRQVLGRSTGT